MRGLFLWVILVNIIVAGLRIAWVIFHPADLSPEEAQYWDWSREIDLSYYSKPPMVAYLNYITTSLLGSTELSVRITPIVLSFIVSIAIFLWVRGIKGEGPAFVSSLFPHTLVGPSINSVLMTTDAPFIFFWGLTVIAIYRGIKENSLKIWILVGILAGLSFLSKYPAVLLFPLTLLAFSLLRPELLKTPKPFVSLIPAFLLSFPVLIWNIKHDFISFKHIGTLANARGSFPSWETFFEFLGGQVLILSIFPFFLLLWGWARAFGKRDPFEVFLTVYSLPVVLFFGILALKKEVYANWAGFAYFTGSVIASLVLWDIFQRRRFIAGFIVAFSCLLAVLLHWTPLLDKIGLTNLLPPKRDPTKIMIGWRKLGGEVESFYSGKELVFSDYYWISAELAFYMPSHPRTFVFHRGRRTQYYLWRDKLKRFKGKHALFVTQSDLADEIKASFEGYEFLKEVRIFWRNEEIRRFRIYRLYGFRGDLKESPTGY